LETCNKFDLPETVPTVALSLLTIKHFASIGSIEKEITWFVP
jgi:hypothetical protein